jgi:hypothetical protein
MRLEIGEQMVTGNVAKALKRQDLLVSGSAHDSPEMANAVELLQVLGEHDSHLSDGSWHAGSQVEDMVVSFWSIHGQQEPPNDVSNVMKSRA